MFDNFCQSVVATMSEVELGITVILFVTIKIHLAMHVQNFTISMDLPPFSFSEDEMSGFYSDTDGYESRESAGGPYAHRRSSYNTYTKENSTPAYATGTPIFHTRRRGSVSERWSKVRGKVYQPHVHNSDVKKEKRQVCPRHYAYTRPSSLYLCT